MLVRSCLSYKQTSDCPTSGLRLALGRTVTKPLLPSQVSSWLLEVSRYQPNLGSYKVDSDILIGFLFGYDSGVITSTIGQPTFLTYFGTPSTAATGGIVSSFTGGAIVGALSVSWLADILGRKKTVFVGGCISAFGCALQAGAATIPMLIAGRFIAGIAVGLLSAIVPMYCVRNLLLPCDETC